MKWANRLIVIAGFSTLGLLLWHFSPGVIWADISQVGILGFCIILPLQLCDHTFNSLGWRFCFTPNQAAGLPFWPLIKGRAAGDGVNYLTPSGTVAGEFIRPGVVHGLRPEQVLNSSVFIAKLSQSLAQPVFILTGLLFLLMDRFNILEGRELLLSVFGCLVVVGLISLALFVLSATAKDGAGSRFMATFGGERIMAMRREMQLYLKKHPQRFVIATIFFMMGYAWGMVEVVIICHFMGLSIDPVQALAVETLSNAIDGLMFMVPAKLGTQEAGKAVIFHILGFQASRGLAFGLIRHVREMLWASLGFYFYLVSQRQARRRPKSSGSHSLQQPV